MKIIQIDPSDNVAVALTDIAKDEELNIGGDIWIWDYIDLMRLYLN